MQPNFFVTQCCFQDVEVVEIRVRDLSIEVHQDTDGDQETLYQNTLKKRLARRDLIEEGPGAFGFVLTFELGSAGADSAEHKQPLIAG